MFSRALSSSSSVSDRSFRLRFRGLLSEDWAGEEDEASVTCVEVSGGVAAFLTTGRAFGRDLLETAWSALGDEGASSESEPATAESSSSLASLLRLPLSAMFELVSHQLVSD